MLGEWLPTWDEFVAGLSHVERETPTPELLSANGLPQSEMGNALRICAWTIFTGEHWEIPFGAITAYLILISLGPRLMKDRDPLPVSSLASAWNLFLAVFSLFGTISTWSSIMNRLYHHGVEATICGHPVFMGTGVVGWAMLLFIYSKLAELIDTVFLVTKKAPVIFLHWYHHVTVLLYCWHSFTVRTTSGIWFCAMNYCVHTIMYFYFFMTQLGPTYRKMARPYAHIITTLQISQMGVGLTVNAFAIYYQSLGHECHTNKTNTILSWLMYASYFVLFGLLYLKNYILGKPATAKRKKEQ